MDSPTSSRPERNRQGSDNLIRLRGSAANGEAPGWRGRLICSDRGKSLDCVENVRRVLLADPAFAGKVFYDEMRERTVVDTLPWHATNRLRDWVDRDDIDLAAWCQRNGLMTKPTTAAAAVQSVAAAFAINPLRDRLDGLVWDGVERLDGWLTVYLGVKRTPYSLAVGRKFLISVVARVYEPGCQVDHTMILEGKQGCGKSSACRILALEDDWFTDEVDKLGSKDSAQDLCGKWLVELSELSSMRKSEIDSVKGYISRRFSHYRPSYGKRSQDFPRRVGFIGTTNSSEYLADETGNRRFWPIKVGEVSAIDLAALRLDAAQLWAEAATAYRKREQWWLKVTEESDAATEQEKRMHVDPWGDLVLDAARRIHAGEQFKKTDGRGYIEMETLPKIVTTNAIMQVLNVPIERRSRREETRIGTLLKANGWDSHDNRRGIPRRWYTPTGSVPTDERV